MQYFKKFNRWVWMFSPYSKGITIFVIGVCYGLAMYVPGTVDARNWEAVFRDIQTYRSQFIPDCINYLCPANQVLMKFPPIFFLIFYVFSHLVPVGALGSFWAMKLIILCFIFLTIFSLAWFGNSVAHTRDVPTVILIFLTLGSLVLNAQFLAYTDILIFPFFIFGVGNLVRKRLWWAGLWYSVSVLVKWQALLVAPIIGIYLLRMYDRKTIGRTLVQFGIGVFCVYGGMYFLNHDVWYAIVTSFRSAVGHTHTLALNIPWIVESILVKGPFMERFIQIERIVFFCAYIATVARYMLLPDQRTRETYSFFQAMMMILLVYYLLSIGVHENHFMLSVIVMYMAYLAYPNRQSMLRLRVVDIINFLSMSIFYGVTGSVMFAPRVWGFDSRIVIAITVSVVLGLWVIRWMRGVWSHQILLRFAR